MNAIELEELAISYPANEDLIQLYQDWGDTEYLQEIFAVLDKYEPEWNKEKELGGWAAEFILDMLQEEEDELKNMSHEERMACFTEKVDERYEDFRCSHQFARVNNITLHLQEGEDLDAILAEGDEQIMFPKIVRND